MRRAAISMLVGMALFALGAPGRSQDGVNFYSIEKEAALGKQLAAELHRRTVSIDSPAVLNFLDTLSRKLSAHLPDVKFPFTFSVLADYSMMADGACNAIHEPIVLPGGYVFVPAGLFVAAEGEDEFAGMLAHAMEHVARRHLTRQATKSGATIPLVFNGGWGGSCPAGLAMPMGFLALQRAAESEADYLAVGTMAGAGFDPNALPRYIERVQVRVPGPLSPMPPRDKRVAALSAAIGKLPKADYAAAPSDEFAAVREEVRRLMEPPAHPDAPSLFRK